MPTGSYKMDRGMVHYWAVDHLLRVTMSLQSLKIANGISQCFIEIRHNYPFFLFSSIPTTLQYIKARSPVDFIDVGCIDSMQVWILFGGTVPSFWCYCIISCAVVCVCVEITVFHYIMLLQFLPDHTVLVGSKNISVDKRHYE